MKITISEISNDELVRNFNNLSDKEKNDYFKSLGGCGNCHYWIGRGK